MSKAGIKCVIAGGDRFKGLTELVTKLKVKHEFGTGGGANFMFLWLSEGEIGFYRTETEFHIALYKEVLYSEFLKEVSIQSVPTLALKEYDKILVRMGPGENWYPQFYSKIESGKIMTIGGSFWKELIPYGEGTKMLTHTNTDVSEWWSVRSRDELLVWTTKN